MQVGKVTAMDEHYVYVAVKQTTACDGCHKKEGCSDCASILEVKAHNDCGAVVGDRVKIETSTARVLLYAFFVFILPFAPAVAAYFAIKSVTESELLPVAAAVVALALFFLLLRLTLDKKSEKRCDRRASEIIDGDNGE